MTIEKGQKKAGQFRSMQLKQKVHRIFILIAAFYIVCLFLSFCLIYQSRMIESASDNMIRDVRTVSNNLATTIEKVNGFSMILFTNKDIVSYLKREAVEGQNLPDKAVMETIYDTMNAYPDVSSVYIIRNDFRFLSVTQGVIRFDRQLIRDEVWRREIDERDGAYVLRVNGDGAWVPQTGGDILTLIRNINDINSLQKLGMMAVNIEVSQLSEIIEASKVDGRNYYLLDHNGDTVYSGNGTQPPKVTIGEYLTLYTSAGLFRKNITCTYRVPGSDIALVCTEHFVLWQNISGELLILLLIMVTATLVMLIVLDRLLAKYITNPIKKLAFTMGSVKDGWLRRASLQTYDDEIGMLKDSYNEMLVEMNRLIEELLQKEKNMRKAEVDILQQQIKPHFLYNTIGMIASLSIDDDVDRMQVYDALETLGSFYRQFLSSGDNEVPLSTEIDIMRKYLKLQKLRYGEVFDDEYDVDESCLDVKLPKLTIQPIVENSLYHGVRMKGEKGTIRIRVYRKQDWIYVEIFDDGVGMSEETIRRVLHEDAKNFGLRRTLERLRYYSKDENVYEIVSKEGEFTKVIFRLREG